jgi:hypothetical protein
MRSHAKLVTVTCLLVFAACTPVASPTPMADTDTAMPIPTFTPTSTSTTTSEPTVTPTPIPTSTPPALEMPAPYSQVSQDMMFAYLEDLTTLQAYSGWRNSATEGEAEGLDYVAATLSEFAYLQDLGLELERQSFHVFLATEIWESRLFLTGNAQEVEVPANAVSGHREQIGQALRFDSDGALNDAERDPVEVAGGVILLRTHQDALDLAQEDAQGRIVFLDFEVIDPMVVGRGAGAQVVTALIQKQVAGLVLVVAGGQGKSAGDGTFLEDLAMNEGIPMLNVRLEDLAQAGIDSWEALAAIETARLIWDTDVFSPGQSGNLVARIPGADSSRAVILGAHIDSANTPGAGDNALNCAVLLEVARVLDEGAVQPPVDIYLVWFGSEELGFHGSQHFVNTHQEVLDRALAAFLMDGFTADEPGRTIYVMQESSHALFGDTRMPFSDYITQKGQVYGIPIEWVLDSEIVSSDDGSFYGFVPAVRFAFGNPEIGHRFHSPYDTVESVQDQGGVMEQSASMALIVALETPLDAPDLRATPEPERRALIIATHTEVLHMTPTNLIHLDRALAWEGFDVDVIPYGQSFTSADLADADLVLALPVIDYPSGGDDSTLYDEQWRPDEIELLVSYVEQGGFLILTNSANHLFRGRVLDANEDWEDANALAAPFGIRFGGVPFRTIRAQVAGTHPIIGDLFDLVMMADNGLPLTLQGGVVLAEAQGEAAIGLLDVGDAGGQVLAVSDLGSLDLYNHSEGARDNLDFLRNIARYAADR